MARILKNKTNIITSCDLSVYIKRSVSRDFLLQVFFHELSSPKPPKTTFGSFRIFPQKIIKTFLIEDFCHFAVVHLELRISPKIFEKI